MDNTVDEMWPVIDIQSSMSDLEQVFATRERCFGGRPEVTQTRVQVAALGLPQLMIEIKRIAHL